MGRVKFCGITIITVILCTFISLIYLAKRTDEVIDLVRETQAFADKGEKGKALEYTKELERLWEDYQNMASVFVRNDKISSVQTSMTRLYPLIQTDSEEIDAEFACVLSELEWIVESEIPRVTNIL